MEPQGKTILENRRPMCALDTNDNADVYYGDNYWNDLACTARMISRRISGHDDIGWWQHFQERSGQSFKRALILNCGNGWVEREMVATGFVHEAVGIDYSEQLLDQARAAAGSLPIRYHQLNINTGDLPDDDFDLVVNHAAAHHITRIDRVFRALCDRLPADGWFISFDYIGPHRNQYTLDAWDAAWRVNQRLPEHVRQTLQYPHIPTMLMMDPTEGVHAELIVPTFTRYFNVDEFVPLGGPIAYPLLTFNEKLFSLVDAEERERWAQHVLDLDAEFLDAHPESSLFAYFTGQPNKTALSNGPQLGRWEKEEEEREEEALRNGGEYLERSSLHAAYEQIAALQTANEELRRELEALRSRYLFSVLQRLLDAPRTQRIIQTRTAQKMVGILRRDGRPQG